MYDMCGLAALRVAIILGACGQQFHSAISAAVSSMRITSIQSLRVMHVCSRFAQTSVQPRPYQSFMDQTALSDDDADVPIASLGRTSLPPPAPASGSGSGTSCSFADGPLIFVAIISDPVGRWHDVCSVKSTAGFALGRALLCEEFPPPPTVPPQNAALVGFAVIRAWRFLVSFPSGKQSQMMMRCAKYNTGVRRKERIIGYVEHEVIAAAALVTPVDMNPNWPFRSAESLGERTIRSNFVCGDLHLQWECSGCYG